MTSQGHENRPSMWNKCLGSGPTLDFEPSQNRRSMLLNSLTLALHFQQKGHDQIPIRQLLDYHKHLTEVLDCPHISLGLDSQAPVEPGLLPSELETGGYEVQYIHHNICLLEHLEHFLFLCS